MKKIICSKELCFQGKFITFFRKVFLTDDGKKHNYEYIQREKGQKAVVIIPFTRDKKQILCIKQFRIPFEKVIIEFPAGLINPGESIHDAALREMKEETGYSGKIISLSKSSPTSPGLTDEEVYFVYFEIDADSKSEQKLDAAESIIPFFIDRNKWKILKKSKNKIQGWVYLVLDIFFKA